MNRVEMIKWLSENTTREQWYNGPATCLPDNCSWFGVTYDTHVVVRSTNKGVKDIILEDVFCEPVPKGDGSMTDYINNSRECFKLSIRPDQWGHCGLPLGWRWSDTNHDMNTIIEHDDLITKFNYSDIFGVGEMPPVEGKELFVDGAKYKLFHDETNGLNDSGCVYTYEAMNDLFNGDDSINLWRGDAVRERKQGARVEYVPYTDPKLFHGNNVKINNSGVFGTSETPSIGKIFHSGYGNNLPTLTPGPIQSPDTDTLYWDKHNKMYCYIVGSAWDDGALFFAEEFVDGDVTGNYFATERMNLVNGDKRASIINIVEEEFSKARPVDSYYYRTAIADRILSEVINHDK